MHNVYVGCIMYADDLILISASVTVLKNYGPRNWNKLSDDIKSALTFSLFSKQ